MFSCFENERKLYKTLNKKENIFKFSCFILKGFLEGLRWLLCLWLSSAYNSIGKVNDEIQPSAFPTKEFLRSTNEILAEQFRHRGQQNVLLEVLSFYLQLF